MADANKDESAKLLNEIKTTLVKAQSDLKHSAEAAMKEAKNAGEMSQQTKDSLDKAMGDINSLRKVANELGVRLGETEQMYARMPTHASAGSAPNIGNLVVAADSLVNYANAQSASFELNKAVAVAIKSGDLRAALTSFGVIPSSPSTPVIARPNPRLTIRDLLAPGQTNSNAIFYIRETGFVNNAASVPENTTKPYSEMTFEEKTQSVKTIAHMLKHSKQILDDLPQLASFINNRLLSGLASAEEAQLLFGSGTGNNLAGIYTLASAYAAPITVTSPNKVDVMRLAMLQAELADLPATGHVLHRKDWAAIELTKDSNGRYLFSDPMRQSTPMMWGLPVAETNATAMDGKFLTGSFAQAAQIFDREDANIVISTENADDFEKNMVSIRCEERLALAVYRPEAFIKGSFPA